MAEVRKKQTVKKHNIDKMLEENEKKNNKKKDVVKKVNSKSSKKENTKNSAWTRFMIFCHGVKSEFKKVVWPSKENMVKYSITTILFIIFLSIFFYAIDVIFALILKLFG